MVQLLYGRGGGKRKENVRVNNIKMHYICATTGHNNIYWKLLNKGRDGRKGIRENNVGGGVWNEQSSVCSQLGYIKKPLCTLTLELKMKNRTIKQIVCGDRGHLCEWGGEWRRWRWENIVDRLHIHIWNKMIKPLVIALSEVGRELWGQMGQSNQLTM
jgi:hypothetical protein